MCGRYVLYGPEKRIIEGFSLRELPPFLPRWNIAPTADVLAVLLGRSGERIARPMRWGLIPGWAKDPSIGARLNNARAETVAGKPAFRSAFRRWRCLLPANGFYEWQAPQAPSGTGGPEPARRRKQPFYIHPADPDALFAMAGLMERWNGPDGPVYSCCVITTEPNALMAPIHDRMPVLLQPAQFEGWLDGANTDGATLTAMLKPADPAQMRARRVSTDVSYARNEGERLIAPLADDGTDPPDPLVPPTDRRT